MGRRMKGRNMNAKDYNTVWHPLINNSSVFIHAMEQSIQKADSPEQALANLRMLGWGPELKKFMENAISCYRETLLVQAKGGDREKLIELLDYSWQAAKSECNKFPRNCVGCPRKNERGDGRECLESLFTDHLLDNGVVVREVGEAMRVEITTDDFRDLAFAKAEGCYRKHYFCPSCGVEIGTQTFDKNRMFGQGTVLHSNKFPRFCPFCGADIKLAESQEPPMKEAGGCND